MRTWQTKEKAEAINGGAIRERLALLACKGPQALTQGWIYDPRRDEYTHPDKPYQRVRITQEGSHSLELIAKRHGIDRCTAMALIGYPEAR